MIVKYKKERKKQTNKQKTDLYKIMKKTETPLR